MTGATGTRRMRPPSPGFTTAPLAVAPEDGRKRLRHGKGTEVVDVHFCATCRDPLRILEVPADVRRDARVIDEKVCVGGRGDSRLDLRAVGDVEPERYDLAAVTLDEGGEVGFGAGRRVDLGGAGGYECINDCLANAAIGTGDEGDLAGDGKAHGMDLEGGRFPVNRPFCLAVA